MKILIIGGSYFFGRVYSIYAAENNEITLFNRGNFPMELSCTEVRGDRHEPLDIAKIPAEDYDAVVDFCAYSAGDIKLLLDNLKGSAKQYILISTGDVCKRVPYTEGLLKKEDFQTEDNLYEGDAGAYISGKIALEKELKECTGEKNIGYTIIRPGVLYGPYNYTPRESEFVREMVTAGQILLPFGADMLYSMCYVKDAALMTLAVTGLEGAFNETFNLAGDAASGDMIADALIAASGKPVQKTYYPEHVLTESGLAVPFGGSLSESQLYDGSKISRLTGVEYTPLSEGMAKAYRAFAAVYGE